jgi:hypothetical protein
MDWIRHAGTTYANLTAGMANRAATHKEHRFRNLSGVLNEANFRRCFQFLRKDAAPSEDLVDLLAY